MTVTYRTFLPSFDINRGVYRNTVLNDRPIAYWRLAEPATTALSSLNDELVVSTGIYDVPPTFGITGPLSNDLSTAVSFNGAIQYGTVAYQNHLNPNQFSFELWANPVGGNGNFRGVLASKFGNTGWILYDDNNNLWSFWIGTGSSTVSITGSAATLNTWTHIVGTYDGVTATLYLNGTAAASGATAFSPNVTNAMTFGQGELGANFFFTGGVSNVSLYDYALTSTQVSNHYTVGTTGTVTRTARGSFNAASGRTATAFPFATGIDTSGPLQANADSKIRQVIAQCQRFYTWLNGASGFIGEIGVPGNSSTFTNFPEFAQWSTVAEYFYRFADFAGWPVTYWTAGMQNYLDGIAAYAEADGFAGPSLTTVLPPARVIENHRAPLNQAYLRGTNLSGPEFGRSAMGTVMNNGILFSAANVGTSTSDYFWPSQADYNFLANRGVKIVRLNLEAERMYPTLFSTVSGLDATQASNLQNSLTFANNAGIKVLLVYQGHLQYVTGTTSPGVGTQVWNTITSAKLNALWFSTLFAVQSYPALYGIGLISEPNSNHAFNLGIGGQITGGITAGATVTSISVNTSHPAIPANSQIWLFLGLPLGFTTPEAFTVTGAGASAGSSTIPVVSKTATSNHQVGDNYSVLVQNCTSDGVITTRDSYVTMVQSAIDFLRGPTLNYTGYINAELFYWSSLSNCFVSHPSGPFATDALGKLNYEAHFYWDSGTTDTLGGVGIYVTTYAQELANAVSIGY